MICNKLKAWEIDVYSQPSKTRVDEAHSRMTGWTLPSHAVPSPG